ncbi:hypothetical protein ACFOEE_15610 [Pseudoalteromonas fenneropenaei]|uniref:Apea-like HEPN domain-containing protein n=1 Tax=Pseudoalteromonas fenneropenaei TaxID=1737459 RepID=A0ABV7CMR2_9GAMM
MIRIGIYGYECKKIYELYGSRIVPLYSQSTLVRKLASDQHCYHLTAFLEISDKCPYELRLLIFNLEAVLSFIDQRDVIITNQLQSNETYERLGDDFAKEVRGHFRRNGGGCVIMSDASGENSREVFINKSLNVLLSETTPENIAFRGAFFRCIEVFRGRASFIDVSYYLLFSGLESFCRAIEDDYSSKNCATPITRVLVGYGFDVKQENLDSPYKSIMTYVHLRNGLFHNGQLEKVAKNGDVFKLVDYLSPLRMLLQLVLIKFIKFDDGYLNWNCWLDGQPFKRG